MMDINRLLSDELTYELKSRGYDLGDGTVKDKRRLLREAIRNEHLGIGNAIDVNVDAKQELTICATKLEELFGDIQEFDVSNRDNEYSRIKSRLIHVQGRLGRIKVTNSETQAEHNKLSDLINELIGTLEEIYVTARSSNGEPRENNVSLIDHPTPPMSASLLDEPIPLVPNSSLVNEHPRDVDNVPRGDLINLGQGREPTEQPRQNVISQIGSVVEQNPTSRGVSFHSNDNINRVAQKIKSLTCNRQPDVGKHFETQPVAVNSTLQERVYPSCAYASKFIDVSRWKLSFDGTSSVTDFLERLEEMRISRDVSKDQLFNSLAELLEGDAAIWYRFARNRIRSYDEFREVLCSSFLPTNYEERIREILRHRTQAATESLVVYVAYMENLYSKLKDKPSEESRVSYIKGKLLPHLQLALAGKGIKTLDALISIGRDIEEANVSALEYHAPPVNPRNSVEPGLEYRRPSNFCVSVAEPQAVDPLPENNRPSVALPPRQMVPPAVKCWDCNQEGHTRVNCPRPRQKYCFRCGRRDVTVRTCPSCSGNGQQRR